METMNNEDRVYVHFSIATPFTIFQSNSGISTQNWSFPAPLPPPPRLLRAIPVAWILVRVLNPMF